MGQIWHAGRQGVRLGRRFLVASAAAALLGAGLAGCGAPASATRTTLSAAVQTTVVPPSGQARTGRPGEVLPPGTLVRTGPVGSAILDTGGRLVWLGAESTVSVVDGTHEGLRAGSVLIDARSGPSLRLQAQDWEITAAPGSAVQVAATFATEVGVLVGSARIGGSTGSVRVPALHQLLATALALPSGELPPLQLTDNRAEKSVAPALVADDVYLRAEARAIDTAPALAAGLQQVASTVVAAAFTASAPRQASESILPLLIAKAARGGGGLTARYRRAKTLRAEGGSWGVIAHLLDATALRTAGDLQALLVLVAARHPGALLGATGVVSGTVGRSGLPGAGAGVGGRGFGRGRSTPPSSATASSAPPPSPAPSSSPGTPSVQQVLNTVSGLLPSLPSPTPSPSLKLG